VYGRNYRRLTLTSFCPAYSCSVYARAMRKLLQ